VYVHGKLKLSPYQCVNILLAVFILLIFIYSAVFSAERSNHPVPSSYKIITGQESSSTGLSRSFSSIVRFQFKKANEYNPWGIRIFLFFLIQLFLRIFFTISYSSLLVKVGIRISVMLDCIISGVMLMVFFEPFWREFLRF
jgi:predicted transcriptional regulator